MFNKSKKPTNQAGGYSAAVIRIPPHSYIHVLDNNKGTTRVEVGPKTFTRQEHEVILKTPESMVIVPPRHYCIIKNPVCRDESGSPVRDEHGNYKLQHGDEEIRFEQDPFPLFPGESIYGKVARLSIVAEQSALRLRATRDFEVGDIERVAGDEWLFEGPATYYPRVEEQCVEVVNAQIIKPNTALKLRARQSCKDRNGVERKAGEEWLVREEGSYLPSVDEEIVQTVRAYILTQKTALHLKADRTFVDSLGVKRKAGEEWIVTVKDEETHIPDVYETVVREVTVTTLNNRQYCVVLDPLVNGKAQYGKKELRKGPQSFFLQPTESLNHGIEAVHVLSEDEALLLTALQEFSEGETTTHSPGDRWMIYGPCDYIPPVEVDIVEKRRSIPLDENEGIYVRDISTGHVRSVIGESYMLKPNEELWDKQLPSAVSSLLPCAVEDHTKVVGIRVPHNAAMQIYDYKEKKPRIVFGPELVMLGPDEQPTVLSLSGDKPKRPHAIKALSLLLGPDFMTDVVIVETSDHARLSLKLSYNWHFEVVSGQEGKLFDVPDFVGDACKAIASRVRGAVAACSFDKFHKLSAKIIRSAVFGVDEAGKVQNRFVFSSNNLVITNIDIQSVEPVDQRTRDSLQKSVQLAIEITTKSQEAEARHVANKSEQIARGALERQKIDDEAKAEAARQGLLKLQAESAAVESTGQATAEAKARSEAAQIEGEAAVKQAQLKAQAQKIEAEARLSHLRKKQEAEVDYQRSLNQLDIEKETALTQIESQKFTSMIDAIGADTIQSIAQAGPEMQAKLLQGLGLKSFLITDGNSPVNLFGVGQGLLGGGNTATAAESF